MFGPDTKEEKYKQEFEALFLSISDILLSSRNLPLETKVLYRVSQKKGGIRKLCPKSKTFVPKSS